MKVCKTNVSKKFLRAALLTGKKLLTLSSDTRFCQVYRRGSGSKLKPAVIPLSAPSKQVGAVCWLSLARVLPGGSRVHWLGQGFIGSGNFLHLLNSLGDMCVGQVGTHELQRSSLFVPGGGGGLWWNLELLWGPVSFGWKSRLGKTPGALVIRTHGVTESMS